MNLDDQKADIELAIQAESKTANKCNCGSCVYHRKIKEVIRNRNVEELVALVYKLADDWLNASMDANYYTSILDGSWPTAVEQLEKALEKAKEKRLSQLTQF